MKDKELQTEVVEETKIEFTDELDGIDIDSLIPSPESSNEVRKDEGNGECIVEDGVLLGLYGEILENCRNDRSEIDEIMTKFLNMVINDGDASSASKEAVVNLMKIKSDASDKMSKIADLMTRIKLKNRDTFPAYLAPQQNSKVVITDNTRDLLKKVNSLTGKKPIKE